MKIIRAEVLGFCMGVRRAVDIAVREAHQFGAHGVYTLGPLIHNPRVLADLKNLGIQMIDELPQEPWDRSEVESLIPNSSFLVPPSCSCIIIRAHGISPDAEKDLRGSGCRIVDATCPRVKASQLKAEELARAGYCLFLAGVAEHAEIESILGYAASGAAPFCAVVSSPSDAEEAALKLYENNKDAKTALLGQTTICEEDYFRIGEAVKKYFPNLKMENTICAATTERQQALRKLLTEVDAVIIAGGKDSANTRRLLAIAEESGKPAALVEDASDIPSSFRFYETIGLCAGASTPDSLITEIELDFLR